MEIILAYRTGPGSAGLGSLSPGNGCPYGVRAAAVPSSRSARLAHQESCLYDSLILAGSAELPVGESLSEGG
jgi:hypothetical protein